MSTQKQRLHALAETRKLTLAERLKAIGIGVPDQDKVRNMMEAIRIGLSPYAPQWRVRWAWNRRKGAGIAMMFWSTHSYDDFLAGKFRAHLLREEASVPVGVQNDAEHIRAAIPEAVLVVCALQSDPWLMVSLGGESLFVRGWIGDKILI